MTRGRPRLEQINIVSANVEASVAFYRRLGVDIGEDGIWRTPTGIHHVNAKPDARRSTIHLDLDSEAFARRWNTGWRAHPALKGRVVVGFGFGSRAAVDGAYADLTGAGHVGLQAPFDAFWGCRYAIVEDPDGVAVGLMSPRSADRISPPPEV